MEEFEPDDNAAQLSRDELASIAELFRGALGTVIGKLGSEIDPSFPSDFETQFFYKVKRGYIFVNTMPAHEDYRLLVTFDIPSPFIDRVAIIINTGTGKIKRMLKKAINSQFGEDRYLNGIYDINIKRVTISIVGEDILTIQFIGTLINLKEHEGGGKERQKIELQGRNRLPLFVRK